MAIEEAKKIINPLIFKHEVCPNCRHINSLVFIDQYKHKTNKNSNPIYSATGLICENCGKEYPIYWKNIDSTLIPYPGNKDREKEVIKEMIKFSLDNVRKLD